MLTEARREVCRVPHAKFAPRTKLSEPREPRQEVFRVPHAKLAPREKLENSRIFELPGRAKVLRLEPADFLLDSQHISGMCWIGTHPVDIASGLLFDFPSAAERES